MLNELLPYCRTNSWLRACNARTEKNLLNKLLRLTMNGVDFTNDLTKQLFFLSDPQTIQTVPGNKGITHSAQFQGLAMKIPDC
jgi:hypothetical protein